MMLLLLACLHNFGLDNSLADGQYNGDAVACQLRCSEIQQFTVGRALTPHLLCLLCQMSSPPETAASIVPMPKLMASTREEGMPISSADLRLLATA